MLQIVLSKPTITTKPNSIQRKIRPKLVTWLMHPIVPKRAKIRGGEPKTDRGKYQAGG